MSAASTDSTSPACSRNLPETTSQCTGIPAISAVRNGETRIMAAPMQAGSTPKATRSDSESIWMPKSISALVRPCLVRATLPSNASQKPQNRRKKQP